MTVCNDFDVSKEDVINDASERPLLTPRGASETGRLENTLPVKELQPQEVEDIKEKMRHLLQDSVSTGWCRSPTLAAQILKAAQILQMVVCTGVCHKIIE